MGAMTIMIPAPRLLAEGFTMVESARWHDGRLWFAHWGSGEVAAVDMDGGSEVVAPGRTRMGWAIDWLPDGRLLVSGEELTRIEPDGSAVRHSSQGGNELVVDLAGHVYLDGADFDFLGGGAPEPGWIRLIDADGTAHDVAGDIDFPNGMVITPDGSTLVIAESFAGRLSAFDIASDGSLSNRRIWADGLGPDGICIDPGGGIWAQTADTFTHTQDPGAPAGADPAPGRALGTWRPGIPSAATTRGRPPIRSSRRDRRRSTSTPIRRAQTESSSRRSSSARQPLPGSACWH